jgi:site-specific DNA recombinase
MKVAIYARYGADKQDARSIDDQVRRCRELAMAKGWAVVQVFTDEAISGSHRERVGLKRLLAAARQKGGSPFARVLVDDLSRLSRELWDLGSIVFQDLALCRVHVIDVGTGMGSDDPNARLMFATRGLVNDAFLENVRRQTHRGLEGRALAGFWTGGRVYGYRTIREPTPADPEHPRAIPQVDPAEAEIVRRIFRDFTLRRRAVADASIISFRAYFAALSADPPRRSSPRAGRTVCARPTSVVPRATRRVTRSARTAATSPK